MRTLGTEVRGIRAPIVKEGDELKNLKGEELLTAMKKEIKEKKLI